MARISRTAQRARRPRRVGSPAGRGGPRRAASRCRAWPASRRPTISTWVGLQSVTSWPKRRCQTSSIGKVISAMPPQSSITAPPSGTFTRRQTQRGRDLAVGAQDHREEARERDPGQAEHDHVVGVVGERAGVAAVVDVDPDVPVEPEGGGDECRGADEDRQRRPAGQAGDARGARSRRLTIWVRPARCAVATQSMPIVAAKPTRVAGIRSEVGAPRAGEPRRRRGCGERQTRGLAPSRTLLTVTYPR